MDIVLASASERRQELLKRVVDDFKIAVSDFDEKKVEFKGDISSYVKEIAFGKALDVSKKFTEKDLIIIGADTVVTYNQYILGKPVDSEDAIRMLSLLSDKTHTVYSGIVMINNSNNSIIKRVQKTDVTFSKLTSKEIKEYVESGEPFGKAGAYAIQGKGGVFVKEIKGCYYNVVGLSLNQVKSMLKRINYKF